MRKTGPLRYWSEEKIETEARKIIVKYGYLPTYLQLREKGYSKFVAALGRHKGIRLLRKKLGEKQLRKERGYWKRWENVRGELKRIWNEHPELGGRVPTNRWMKKHGYSSIGAAIYKYHGKMKELRKKLGEETKIREIRYWNNWDNFKAELDKMWEKHPELEGKLPGGDWLNENGYSSLNAAISRYHGKIREVRIKLGQEPNAEENELEELLRGYVEDG